MTEQEWLDSDDPIPMLEFLRGKASDRKLRLFAVGCSRRVWRLLVDPRSQVAVEIAERYSDGLASEEECRSASRDAILAIHRFDNWEADPFLQESYRTAAHAAAWVGVRGEEGNCGGAARKAEVEEAQHWESLESNRADSLMAVVENDSWRAKYLRCIFGDPYRPVTIDPRLLTSTVIDLANAIYDERAFDRMPILADALMDAGCASEEIIAHCRQSDEHVRGCWVVDLLLAKT